MHIKRKLLTCTFYSQGFHQLNMYIDKKKKLQSFFLLYDNENIRILKFTITRSKLFNLSLTMMTLMETISFLFNNLCLYTAVLITDNIHSTVTNEVSLVQNFNSQKHHPATQHHIQKKNIRPKWQ